MGRRKQIKRASRTPAKGAYATACDVYRLATSLRVSIERLHPQQTNDFLGGLVDKLGTTAVKRQLDQCLSAVANAAQGAANVQLRRGANGGDQALATMVYKAVKAWRTKHDKVPSSRDSAFTTKLRADLEEAGIKAPKDLRRAILAETSIARAEHRRENSKTGTNAVRASERYNKL